MREKIAKRSCMLVVILCDLLEIPTTGQGYVIAV
jgi:hypothetical protein